MPGDFEVSFGGVVCGFHVYQAVWSPVIGEELSTEQEHGNPEDAFAVVIMKSGTTVVHMQRLLGLGGPAGHGSSVVVAITNAREPRVFILI